MEILPARELGHIVVARHRTAREDLLGDEPHELQVRHRDRDAHLRPALER